MPKKRLAWDESVSASSSAGARLPAMLQTYYDQGRKLMGRSHSAAAMHPFRLETKALRYTLELFRPFFGPGLEGFLSSLRRIQDCLGARNDYATTRDLIAARLPKQAPDREEIYQVLKARVKRKSSEFRRYWRQTFDKPGENRRWLNYISRPRKAGRSRYPERQNWL
jgi:CHAD domain-containing protein